MYHPVCFQIEGATPQYFSSYEVAYLQGCPQEHYYTWKKITNYGKRESNAVLKHHMQISMSFYVWLAFYVLSFYFHHLRRFVFPIFLVHPLSRSSSLLFISQNASMTNSGINIKALHNLTAAFIMYEPQWREASFTFPFYFPSRLPPLGEVKLVCGIQTMELNQVIKTHASQ